MDNLTFEETMALDFDARDKWAEYELGDCGC